MPMFRKKPVVIEARQFPNDGPNQLLVSNWVEESGGKTRLFDGVLRSGVDTGTNADWNWAMMSIETPEGVMHAKPGDWIIKGVKGEFYPCKADIFAATYEAAPVNEGE